MSAEAKVSCRALADVLGLCAARGIALHDIADGLSVDLRTLRDRRAQAPWNDVSVVIERLAERLGGDEQYAELITGFVDHPKARHVRRFLRLASTPKRNCRLVFEWAGPMTFPFVRCVVRELGPDELEITQKIPAHLRGSRPFLLSAVTLARALPHVHGLSDAHVTAEVGTHELRMVVRLPRTVSRFHRVMRWVGVMADAPSLVEELIAQQQELQKSYANLETAFEEGRAREARLAEEIRAKKAAETELAERNEQLLQAQRLESVGRLAGGVAHDFNNLLTAILIQTEMLLSAPEEGDLVAGLTDIQDAGQRAAALTRQLLTFAKQQPVERRLVDVGALVRGLEGLLVRLLQGIAIEVLVEDRPMTVCADPVQLEQVLLNLAVNARDAMPEGGTLTVRVAEATVEGRAHVRIDVRDVGMGMSPDVQASVFEPFFTTKGELGTGLGLATAYGIVSDSGGRIELDSELGAGTTFSVLWPASDGLAEPAGVTSSRAKEAGREGGAVLLIEDQIPIRRIISRVLTNAGYEVYPAEARSQAMAHAAERPLDLVISDIMLKGDRGPAIVRDLLQLQPSVRALFISGYADAEDLSELEGAPLLAKPFSMTQLLEAVEALRAG